jgi:hypothetical protein
VRYNPFSYEVHELLGLPAADRETVTFTSR